MTNICHMFTWRCDRHSHMVLKATPMKNTCVISEPQMAVESYYVIKTQAVKVTPTERCTLTSSPETGSTARRQHILKYAGKKAEGKVSTIGDVSTRRTRILWSGLACSWIEGDMFRSRVMFSACLFVVWSTGRELYRANTCSWFWQWPD